MVLLRLQTAKNAEQKSKSTVRFWLFHVNPMKTKLTEFHSTVILTMVGFVAITQN